MKQRQGCIYIYVADLWVSGIGANPVERLTSTPAVESTPHFYPDDKWIVFASSCSGWQEAYIVASKGDDPKGLPGMLQVMW